MDMGCFTKLVTSSRLLGRRDNHLNWRVCSCCGRRSGRGRGRDDIAPLASWRTLRLDLDSVGTELDLKRERLGGEGKGRNASEACS